MAGFNGSTGVPQKQMNDAIQQSTAFTALALTADKMTVDTGSIHSASRVNLFYNEHMVIVNGRIRIQNPNGRPTVTVNDIPATIWNFSAFGPPAQMRVGNNSYIGDVVNINHQVTKTTMTVGMENYLSTDVPAGNGYIVYQFACVYPF